MFKDNLLKYIEKKNLKVTQQDTLTTQAYNQGYNQALHEVVSYICCVSNKNSDQPKGGKDD